MTNQFIYPDSIADFSELIKSTRDTGGSISIFGSTSKIRISQKTNHEFPDVKFLSTDRLSGIVDHQASDFTITARAGTPVRELVTTLAAAGQFLPFDPVFVSRGATVGGMVATGLNGPCRLRSGGLRDFVIGCQLIGSNGQAINSGGRVVKNAAGFDLPKFMIGSAGRFGLLTEITFKVFPKPHSFQTLLFETRDIDSAYKLSQTLNLQMDFDAIEISSSNQVIARLSGHSDAVCDQLVDEVGKNTPLGFDRLTGKIEKTFWTDLSNFQSLSGAVEVVKVPLTPARILEFDQFITSSFPTKLETRYSSAGNVAILYAHRDQLGSLNDVLQQLKLCGQVVAGDSGHFLLGKISAMPFLTRIKQALDPDNLFGHLQQPVPAS